MRRFLLGLIGFIALPAWSQGVCSVAAVTGEVQSSARQLVVGDALDAGAEIRTGAAGRVRLRCVDGSSLVLGDHSLLKLTRYAAATKAQPRDVSLWLQLGVLGQKVAHGGAWEVRTPSAVTAVRGTEFVVEVAGDQATAVHVDTGVVAVESTSKTRSLVPRPPTRLDKQANGTQCSPIAGCSAAKAWSEQRVQALQDRLAGV